MHLKSSWHEKRGSIMMRILGFFAAFLFLVQCNNLYGPLTDDREVTAQGRLDRAKRYLTEGNFVLANQDVGGALSLDSTLSEAYYLRAQIALWQYKTAISEVRGPIAAIADTTLTDTTAMPFSTLRFARKDSVYKANIIALENFEILRTGKVPGAATPLDSLYLFSDLYIDYVITCEVLGMTSLFDLDTNAEIDSLDSLGLVGLHYSFGDTGFALRAGAGADPADAMAAINQSRSYFALTSPYLDSITFSARDTSNTAKYRRDIKNTILEFVEDLPRYASKRGMQ